MKTILFAVHIQSIVTENNAQPSSKAKVLED